MTGMVAISSQAIANNNSNEGEPSISDKDILTIQAKKDALLYLLMEKGELSPLLDELKERERKENVANQFKKDFPFTSKEIKKRREMGIEEEKALNSPIRNKHVKISEEDYIVDGSTPIYLNVSANNPSSLAFFDYQGNPWPIVGDIIGNAAFNSTPFGESKNTAVFQINQRFSETVSLINLQGIDQLVVVKLIGNEEKFDARKNIRLPLIGPLSGEKIVEKGSAAPSSDPVLIQLLNGERIHGGKHYVSEWDDNSVFVRVGNLLYVRTKDVLTFPPNQENQRSANGYNLYKLDFSNTLTMRKDGQYEILRLSAVKEIR